MDEQLLSNLIAFLGAFGTPIRMRIAAAIIEAPKTASELALDLGDKEAKIVHELDRMIAMGYVYRTRIDGLYAVDEVAIGHLIDEARKLPLPAPADQHDKVIRAFFRDGRLTGIPVHQSKRLIVLDEVARLFEAEREYPEREVNAILRRVFDDHCALRRALVDHQFLTRHQNVYRRVITQAAETPPQPQSVLH